MILSPSSPFTQNHGREDGITGSSAPASRVSTDIRALCLVGDGMSALGLPGMGQAEVGKEVTGLYQCPTVGKLEKAVFHGGQGCPGW